MLPPRLPNQITSDATRALRSPPALFVHLRLGLMIWTLLHASQAPAADRSAAGGTASKPDGQSLSRLPMSAFMQPIPEPYRPADFSVAPPYSEQDFRPRPRSSIGREHAEATTMSNPLSSEPLASGTPVWQRLSEYRTHNRVRLVTLWETGGNSLSLQAGPRGGPTLQWTSRLTTPGRGPRGILDELFPTSMSGARGLHWTPRATAPDAGGKAARAAELGLASAGK